MFDVSIDYLLEGKEQEAITVNFQDNELLKVFEEVEKLSDQNKNHIKAVIRAFVKTDQHQQVANSEIIN